MYHTRSARDLLHTLRKPLLRWRWISMHFDEMSIAQVKKQMDLTPLLVADSSFGNCVLHTTQCPPKRSWEILQRHWPTVSGSSFCFQVQSFKKGRLHRTPVKYRHRHAHIPPAHGGSMAENWTSYQIYSWAVRTNMCVHQRLGKIWRENSDISKRVACLLK